MSAVSLQELQAALRDRTATVVDVLPAAVHRIARIPGSVNLPIEDIDAKAGQVLADRARPVIVYCGGPT